MEVAAEITRAADYFIVAGTSMLVYPAAGLIEYARREVPKFIVDPVMPSIPAGPEVKFSTEKASVGMEKVKEILLKER
jgi:NAD-dependent deacetylase